MDEAIRLLEALQKRAPKSGSPKWWSREYLYKEQEGLSKRLFESALAAIREKRASGWLYIQRGRESAYFLSRFTDQLPERFRPDPSEQAAASEREIEEHVLDTIEVGLREYHSALDKARSQALPEDFVGRAVDPYYLHVLGLAKARRIKVPDVEVPDDLPPASSEFLENSWWAQVVVSMSRPSVREKVKFLLDLKAALARRYRASR
ncbi:MAG TPA: hypothetical protein VEO20_00665 [Thermoplasmata archaeon]|nr:hypothetical protein [Thermoplasmata archaeon]